MNVTFEALLWPALDHARAAGVPFLISPLTHLGESRHSLVRRYYTMKHQIELIPPAEYLRMSYYEKWNARLVELLVKSGLVTRAEIESGKPAQGSPKATPKLTVSGISSLLAPANPERPKAKAHPRFKVGQRVRARNMHPAGHTRLPLYARGKRGKIVRDHGIFVFPDTNAHFLGEKPQHLYSVRFTARELWGEQAAPRDSVYVDIWDDYLERA